jgi:hypothetical protein
LTLYLDTSLLVAALTNETETGLMQAWLGEQEPSGLAISDWVITEFSAVLSMKLRSGQIEPHPPCWRASDVYPAERRELDYFAGVLLAIPHSGTIRGPVYVGLARWRCLASRYLRRSRCNPVHTLDRLLSEAGPALGVKTMLLSARELGGQAQNRDAGEWC